MAITATAPQELSIADVLNSASVTNTSVNTTGIDLRNFKKVRYFIQCASLGAAGTVDGRLQVSATSNFASATNVAGTNLAQLVANNATADISMRSDQAVATLATARYVRLQLTCGGNALTVGAHGDGLDPIQAPANQYDLTTAPVPQRVVCSV
jgi:hypothetical protein